MPAILGAPASRRLFAAGAPLPQAPNQTVAIGVDRG